MTRRETIHILTAALLVAVISISIFAQAPPTSTHGSKPVPRNDRTQPEPSGQSMILPAGLNLTEGEKSLVGGSRAAILRAGISAPYFEKHFRLVRVVDNIGDRRVVWKFTVNEYEVMVTDAVGFYTDGGRRVDVNSIASSLASAHDITRTIPRKVAERIMRRCIGNFGNPAIEYRAFGTGGEAALLLTAQSAAAPKVVASRAERERREREKRERQKREEERKRLQEQGVMTMPHEDEEEDRPKIIIGMVNLETGKCTKGLGIAGASQK